MLTLIVRTVTDGCVEGLHLCPHVLLPRQSGSVHDFGRVTAISWRYCSSRTTSPAAFLNTLSFKTVSSVPHLPYIAVLSQRNSPWPHLFRPRRQRLFLDKSTTTDDVPRSFVVLCAPKRPNVRSIVKNQKCVLCTSCNLCIEAAPGWDGLRQTTFCVESYTRRKLLTFRCFIFVVVSVAAKRMERVVYLSANVTEIVHANLRLSQNQCCSKL